MTNLTDDEIQMILDWYFAAEAESKVGREDADLALALWEELPESERGEFRG